MHLQRVNCCLEFCHHRIHILGTGPPHGAPENNNNNNNNLFSLLWCASFAVLSCMYCGALHGMYICMYTPFLQEKGMAMRPLLGFRAVAHSGKHAVSEAQRTQSLHLFRHLLRMGSKFPDPLGAWCVLCERTNVLSHTHICIFTHKHTHTHMHTYLRTHIHTHTHTYTHTCIHTYIHTHMHTCTHTHLCWLIYAYTHNHKIHAYLTTCLLFTIRNAHMCPCNDTPNFTWTPTPMGVLGTQP